MRAGAAWKARRGGLSGKAELFRDDPAVDAPFAPETRAEFEDFEEAVWAAECLNRGEREHEREAQKMEKKGGSNQR
jgi:hypothetical protein